MTDDLTLNMDAYLPLRDVVFNTLRRGNFKRRSQTGRAAYGVTAGSKAWGEPYTDP